MEKNINEDLEHVVNWSKLNNMVISQTKKKSMLAVGKQLWKCLDSTEVNLNLSLNGAIIEQVKSHCFSVFIYTKLLTLTPNQMLYVNRYQRKLDFSSTLVHT